MNLKRYIIIFLGFFSLLFPLLSQAQSLNQSSNSKYARPKSTQVDPRLTLFEKQQKLLCKRSHTCKKDSKENISFRLIYQNRYEKPKAKVTP